MKNKPKRIRINGIFKKNDRVLWDSGFGYEIAAYVSQSNDQNTFIVELYSGSTKGCFIMVDQSQLFHYNPELSAQLALKYGYERSFKNVHIQKN